MFFELIILPTEPFGVGDLPLPPGVGVVDPVRRQFVDRMHGRVARPWAADLDYLDVIEDRPPRELGLVLVLKREVLEQRDEQVVGVTLHRHGGPFSCTRAFTPVFAGYGYIAVKSRELHRPPGGRNGRAMKL